MKQLTLFHDPDYPEDDPSDLVFCWFFRHPKTGKIIHAKNGHPFCFRRPRR